MPEVAVAADQLGCRGVLFRWVQLRQCCDHALLFHDLGGDDALGNTPAARLQALLDASGKMQV